MRTPSIYSQDDPLTEALKPPESETELERRARLEEEAEAKRVSEQIDEELRLERESMKRKRGDVKLLLLGQAESGKSTLQRQFQLMYKPHSLEQERASWRTVIYFNVVRSIKHILNTLESWDDYIDDDMALDSPTSKYMGGSRSASPFQGNAATSRSTIASLRRRLSPLVTTDTALADRLSGGITVSGSGKGGVFVRSGWQARTIENALGRKRGRVSDELSPKKPDEIQDVLVQDVSRMLDASKDDIRELWAHPTVKGLIVRRRLKLDEWSEFFLRHITRVAASDYVPSTDDILHARIQTMGVAEHIFDVNIHGKSVSWHLFDVGGARGQRHTWVPYFDDANAIIFVAPVSAFDQYLEEDPRTNRIDDSLQLFTQICSSPLLKNAHLVLFLNKTDLLRAKLDNGLRVQKYITSFGERANDYETVVQYFRAHFLQVHRRNNENRRVLYTHFTSVVDTKATQRIIGNVRDSIFRGYLQSAALV
ncbi:guanine nucleotide-binding protein [Lentinula edodes]|uniref:Guanine nucleotide-binding protein n=1 Tax=Lentinula edodes TaxID=5353 RepID=A0A1Q3DYV9_LENED|nr:G-protein alpha subunit [Lentinula edodes]KAH7868421.1 G-protein alpha subunit [Lentinula edodes]KAJ3900799.1 guanine nucleotide-binding protein [Lentinula edodes]GAW00185.1 guanine nucleotide-binding protein [Lentinula edodes]